MQLDKKLLIAGASFLAALLLVIAIGNLHFWNGTSSPLGEAKPIEFPSISASEPRIQHFLDGDFEVIARVEALPRPLLAAFTEQGGSRVLIANPGKRFNATDVVDNTIPNKRLIFAGVSDNKWFVHYEQGGRGHSYILAFFTLTSSETMTPLWRAYCDGPATNIQELRSKLTNGACSQSPYRRH